MKGLALSQYKTYVYPVMNTKDTKISYHLTYGGEDSESIPCGFVSNLVYEKKYNKKQKKNRRYRMNKTTKTLTPKGDNRGLGVSNMKS